MRRAWRPFFRSFPTKLGRPRVRRENYNSQRPVRCGSREAGTVVKRLGRIAGPSLAAPPSEAVLHLFGPRRRRRRRSRRGGSRRRKAGLGGKGGRGGGGVGVGGRDNSHSGGHGDSSSAGAVSEAVGEMGDPGPEVSRGGRAGFCVLCFVGGGLVLGRSLGAMPWASRPSRRWDLAGLSRSQQQQWPPRPPAGPRAPCCGCSADRPAPRREACVLRPGAAGGVRRGPWLVFAVWSRPPPHGGRGTTRLRGALLFVAWVCVESCP